MVMIKQSSRGFAIVTAIFLMVVLGALGTMMLTFFAAQQQSSAMDIMGSRAYQAARAGIEWAAVGVSNTPAGTLWAGCASGMTINANTMKGTLAPFTVTLTCSSSSATPGLNGNSTMYIYTITSTSTGPNGVTRGSQDFVSRTLTATMVD